ncbi:MAG TPA: M23 family metallopeptidase [Marinagarivorans sp.]
MPLKYCLTSLAVLCCALAPQLYAATFTGTWVQGGLITGRASPGEQVFFNGRELSQSGSGHFAFGLGRDAPKRVAVEVKADGAVQTLTFEVEQRAYKIQRIEGVQQKHVTPPKALTDRIQREARAVRKARERNDLRTDFLTSFIWPASGRVTGVYGSQRFYNGTPKSPHYGIDIAGPKGAPVRAPAAGVVTFANNDLYYSGGTLIVDHGLGISSTFIHLSKIEVALGDVVQQGDLIARIGSTGRSTGPHLDWRMNWFSERIDPQLLFPENAKPESP